MPYVSRLERVNPIAMSSKCTVNVVLHWRDDRIIKKEDCIYVFDWSCFGGNDPRSIESWKDTVWHPDLRLDYIVGGAEEGEGEVLNIEVMSAADGTPHAMMYLLFTYEVRHKMDLRWFPFDTQALVYYFMLIDQPAATAAVLVPHEVAHMLDASGCLGDDVDDATDGYAITKVRLVPDACEEDWSRVLSKFGILSETEKAYASGGRRVLTFSNMELRVLMRRQPFFFIAKVVAVVLVLMLLAPVTFRLDSDAVADRLSISVTLILTAVAFQYAVNAFLPILPYMTCLDSLILFMYILYTFCFFENVAVYEVQKQDPELAEQIDRWSFIAYLVGVGLSVVLLLCSAVRGARVPELFSHFLEQTLLFVPPVLLDRLPADVLRRLRATPIAAGFTIWESSSDYRLRMKPTWDDLAERIRAAMGHDGVAPVAGSSEKAPLLHGEGPR